MRLLLLIFGIGVGIIAIGPQAKGQNYPWCAIYSVGASAARIAVS